MYLHVTKKIKCNKIRLAEFTLFYKSSFKRRLGEVRPGYVRSIYFRLRLETWWGALKMEAVCSSETMVQWAKKGILHTPCFFAYSFLLHGANLY
jgi:hypothetical protein